MNRNLTDPASGSVESCLQHEAMPPVLAMTAILKAIKAMTDNMTIKELARHGAYLGDVAHNDLDLMREQLADARAASLVPQP
jgi:hypothetical protein